MMICVDIHLVGVYFAVAVYNKRMGERKEVTTVWEMFTYVRSLGWKCCYLLIKLSTYYMVRNSYHLVICFHSVGGILNLWSFWCRDWRKAVLSKAKLSEIVDLRNYLYAGIFWLWHGIPAMQTAPSSFGEWCKAYQGKYLFNMPARLVKMTLSRT